MILKKIILFIVCLPLMVAWAQDYPKGYFRSPLDIPLLLSGSFGELRSNHFHTGLDIKTNGVEGLKIYACAEGVLSRIKISHWGYGKVLYINHPNGYTTVYAHLSKFNSRLEKFVKEKQYELESEEIDITLSDSTFVFRKGEVIAYSGNTGSSGGPHLHFEIRETQSEKALNPLLFGFNISDNLSPDLYHIKIYPLKNGWVNAQKNPLVYKLIRAEGKYNLQNNKKIKAYGNIGLAIHGNDLFNATQNKCGIYSIEMYVNDTLYYKQVMDKIDFAYNRYINSHMDYIEFNENKNSYHKSFIDGNNPLEIYPVKKNAGIIHVNGNKNYKIKYLVRDVYNNLSKCEFEIIPEEVTLTEKNTDCENYFEFNKENQFKTELIEVNIPMYGIYNNYCFQYKKIAPQAGMCAAIHYLHNYNTPVQEYFQIKIKIDSTVSEKLYPKVCAVYINKKGKINAEGGYCENGYITFKSRAWGKYSAMIDTVAPFITPLNINEGKNMKPTPKAEFSIGDNLSGIKSYKAYINGKWILSHYNVKKGKLSINFIEEKIPEGKHQLDIILTDERNNVTNYKVNFEL